MEKLIFTYTRENVKKEKLVQKDGWYKINIGKLNAFNLSNQLYLADGVKEMINNPTSRIGSKLAQGYLKGEREHPTWEKGMTKQEYMLRLLEVKSSNVSHHIKSIEIEDTGIPTGHGIKGNILNITAWIKPDAGPLGQQLKADLDDPEINVAFSIRSFVKDEFLNGINLRKIETLITFDWVFMPGMDTANKFDTKEKVTVGTESIDSGTLLDNIQLNDIILCENILKSTSYVGNESANDILGTLGDVKKSINPKSFGLFKVW